MEYERIRYESGDGVALLTLCRDEKLNAIDARMRDEVVDALEACAADADTRALVLTGRGRAFSVGVDVKNPPVPKDLRDKIAPRRRYSYYPLIEDLGKPVIAAISGYCLGGGLELACACDIRIAADSAELGDAHAKLGVIGGGGATQRLPRLIGVAKAKELIFSGEPIGAQEALRIGLVNRVVPDARLLDEALALARHYATRPPLVLALAKAAIDDGMRMGLAEGLNYEAKCAALVGFTEDYREGIAAFLAKRAPRFRGC